MTPEHLPTEQYDAQLAEKVVRLQSLMTPFYAQAPEVFRSPVSHYRMRAEFRLWHDGDPGARSRVRPPRWSDLSLLQRALRDACSSGARAFPRRPQDLARASEGRRGRHLHVSDAPGGDLQ